MNAYLFLIGLCIIIIVSFFTNMLARKTNIPSVLILILLGVGLQQLMIYFDMEPNYFRSLEILGIVGLIMIVLEAALDLELKKENWPTIWKSFTIASMSLGFTSVSIALFIPVFIPGIDFLRALVYALPLSIMSSAIIIPSVANLSGYKKEFLIYESTFSDILGIMVFYMIIENLDVEGMRQLSFAISSNILLTLLTSVLLCYALLYIIQNIKGDAKFFLFLAVLVLLYAVGKLFHLSSLIIILMFGLLLRNYKILLFGQLRKWLDDGRIDGLFDQFKMITKETSFLVRTFFFVVFGMTLPLSTLFERNVWLISIIFLIITYVIKFGLYFIIERKEILSRSFIAPKGLITVLLFFAIPDSLREENFEAAVLFVVIIVTNIIMGWVLIASGKSSSEITETGVTGKESSGNGNVQED
ncbi:MAG TPA: cation:proton antiporter [Draconibacterium sp.]|nr:cation:proton antiporter [Draconibacterium sp.]